MLDKNKLNRIKGILSAKQGAEVPKFINGAKFAKQKDNVIIYSGNETEWFSDPDLKIPYTASMDGFKPITLPSGKPTTEVIGAPSTDTNQAVKKAALVMDKANEVSSDLKATLIGNLEFLLPEVEIVASKNNPTVTDLPSTVDTSEERLKSLSHWLSLAQLKIESDKLAAAFSKNAKAGAVALFGTLAFTAIGDAFGAAQSATDSDLTKGITAGYKGVQNIVSNFGPVGQMASSIMGIASATGDILQSLGGGTDQQTTLDKWMDSPLLSWNVGAVNGFLGKKSDSFGIDTDTVESVGSSYGDTVGDLKDALEKANKKYGLFSSKSRKRANAAIADAKAKQNLMADISDTAMDQRLAVSSMGDQAGIAYSMMTGGGYDLKYTYAAKHGGLLEWNPIHTLEWQPLVELNWVLPEFKEGGNIEINKELVWIPEFKEGGKALETDIPETEETTQKNVIPEGALHKNKHHMEHAEGLTKKGIPVIDGDGEQQAEIEHSEIIFTLEVTKKLEEYYEIFYSDKSSNSEKELAALEAGKLLVYLILENTEDRTGLIDSCKKGGSLTLKKSTDDLIEEMLNWTPTLMIVELVTEETLEKDEPKEEKPKEKPKEKSEKEQMKEAIKEVLIELLTK